ncbi:MAG: AAA family ATPase [Candidatus Hodarchaeales archaeon]|jgi:predicted AAA+ superfamily ATPase
MDCLKEGIFARTTIKPLTNVFGLEKEKSQANIYLSSGEWFTIAGLRRTGKTTMIRSVARTIKDTNVIYLNMWELTPNQLKLEHFLDLLTHKIQKTMRKDKKFLQRIEIDKVQLMGVSVKVEKKQQLFHQVLENVLSQKPMIWILDEIQELSKDSRVFKYLAALHDKFAPNLSVVFLGSVVALRQLLKITPSNPLYGRLSHEILLSPFDEVQSRELLKEGFNQCGKEITENVIIEAALQLGGFAGWLTHFGRLLVLDSTITTQTDIDMIKKSLNLLEAEAESLIVNEVARLLYDKRKAENYLKLLKTISDEGNISLSKAAQTIDRNSSTTYEYLDYLYAHGILKKTNKTYFVGDPLTRRIFRKPDIDKRIKAHI